MFSQHVYILLKLKISCIKASTENVKHHFLSSIWYTWWSAWIETFIIVLIVLENRSRSTRNAYVFIKLIIHWKSIFLGFADAQKPILLSTIGLYDGLTALGHGLSCSSSSKTPIYILRIPGVYKNTFIFFRHFRHFRGFRHPFKLFFQKMDVENVENVYWTPP